MIMKATIMVMMMLKMMWWWRNKLLNRKWIKKKILEWLSKISIMEYQLGANMKTTRLLL